MRVLIAAACLFLWGYIDGKLAMLDEQIVAEAIQRADEKKAQIFHALAKCMSEPATLRVGDDPVADCKPRRGK